MTKVSSIAIELKSSRGAFSSIAIELKIGGQRALIQRASYCFFIFSADSGVVLSRGICHFGIPA